ncbi:GH116 family glycosyl-hydrolase [Paenibacillus sp. 1001270B_150601_E10]|uniref:GH116 family glycosyl-hydrolase n=1 Tax=Paenibacillus sp. 1001270B_150601_E10 TaxID=2787079 RepID=UPI00189D638B|nr:GH116 family glycosyl-hydrolase [Paenibacillus sp. 1001270B_150601_E10]
MSRFTYKGERAKEISFPLGGIGSGSIGLSGCGRLIDWEIYNRPNKQSDNYFSHFAVKAEADGELVDARVLHGDLPPSYMGNIRYRHHSGYGFGPNRSTLAGVPHFEDLTFTGEFPIAKLVFNDRQFPGKVQMTAFNPFIPLNDQDSSIPGAYFDIELTNTSDRALDYTVALTVSNPFMDQQRYCKYTFEQNIHWIKQSSSLYKNDDPKFGDITIATDADEASYQEYWYRGGWFDNVEMFWNDFATTGKLKSRHYESAQAEAASEHTDHSTLAAHVKLSPGEKRSVRFIISWSFPNYTNYWNPEKCEGKEGACDSTTINTWKNYYAALFADSTASAVYSLQHWDRLYDETLKFKEALFASTLPPVVLEAVSANLSVLKSPTCVRLADGSFYGWEGCLEDSGSCEGSCTHVWNYAYALPFLFPKLERSMRDLDYRYNQREDGRMQFRLTLPLGRMAYNHRACADGQFGGVMKTYRDWKICGDTEWLKTLWPEVKKSIEYAWAATNEDQWDVDQDGVLEGRQHHTLDMELFGPNAWLNGFYLGALKAGAEMALALGEPATAQEYLNLFTKGKAWTNQYLFNGSYYQQMINVKDKAVLEVFDDEASAAYWNEEKQEIKYQVADGCGIDQVVAQWHANLMGLGEIFDPVQTKSALASIYKYNFKKSIREVFNPCRIYSLNDEAGLMICTWPEGTRKPAVPLTYAQETMTGFEYQAAIHMIQEGLVSEGFEIVEAIRDRFDGYKRNPWNEFECGSHYARSLASYALLPAISGFEYNMVEGMIGFDPVGSADEFQTFWSLDAGWGTFTRTADQVMLHVLYGTLSLHAWRLPFLSERSITSVKSEQQQLHYAYMEGAILFDQPIQVGAGTRLMIEIAAGE